MILREHCQRENILGKHALRDRIRWRLRAGPVAMRTILRASGRVVPEGRLSRYAAGQRVRIVSADKIRATLNARGELRGLPFLEQQWALCGLTFPVRRSVRRFMDDEGKLRTINATVTLEGVTCDGINGSAGCGRGCFLLWRDDWLELADPASPIAEPSRPPMMRVRVRSLTEIRRTLDIGGGRDGLMFMPEMARYAGNEISVRQMKMTGEAFRIVPVRSSAFYISPQLYCTGSILKREGPCQRECALLWHRDWLVLDEPT